VRASTAKPGISPVPSPDDAKVEPNYVGRIPRGRGSTTIARPISWRRPSKPSSPETKINHRSRHRRWFLYYDFDRPQPFTPDDLERIEAKMREIIAADHTVQRMEWPRGQVRDYFGQRAEDYKVELLDEFEGDVF